MREQKRRGGILLCCVIYILAGIYPMYSMAAEHQDHITEASAWADSPAIMGESGIVMEMSTGTILYEKNMHDAHYPASITKIMTALLAIENCEMDEIVTVPPEAVYMEDKGTHIALDAGEQLTVEQCLYAVMLASANDAAYALAEHVGGTYENFIRMMNEKAKEIGCQNTNFTNAHGLPDESHVTSAYDMALITKAVLQYDIFRTVSGTTYYEIPPTEYQKDLICMYNHHKMIGKTEFQNAEVFAGKNGYTNAAGYTLVTCAQREDMVIICVVMGGRGDSIYQDTLKLLNYGLDGFEKVKIREDKAGFEEMLRKENPVFANYAVSELDMSDAYVVVPKGADISDLQIKFEYGETEPKAVTAQYFYEDHLVGQVDFTAEDMTAESDREEDAAKEPLPEEKEEERSFFGWKQILLILIAGILAAGVFVKISLERKRSRNRRNSRNRRKQWESGPERRSVRTDWR